LTYCNRQSENQKPKNLTTEDTKVHEERHRGLWALKGIAEKAC